MLGTTIGDIEVRRIIDMAGPFRTPFEMFEEATPEIIDGERHWLVPRAMCPDTDRLMFQFQSYLVKTRHHTILMDTCIGCDKQLTRMPDWHMRDDRSWLNNLAAAGAAPEDIDYVFCSHLHVDHVGWNTMLADGRWVPTFPNAKYIFSKNEFAAAQADSNTIFKQSLLPVLEAGQAVLVDLDYALDDQVWLQPTTGHTIGHVAVNLSSNGANAAMCGDLIHTPLQCRYPEWSPVFDFDKEEARQTRRRFLEQHCGTDTVILTQHFPAPSMGHVVADAEAFEFRYLG
jgi:glyoxylase-like metal-dependent hydrolase (beta-lactamase superfamily II)